MFNSAQTNYRKNNSTLKTIAAIVLIVSLCCVGGGIYFYLSQRIPSSYVSASGEITKVNSIYHPKSNCHRGLCDPPYYSYTAVVSFSVKGNSYTFISNYGSPPFQGDSPIAGNPVHIRYNPSNPGKNPKDTSNKLNEGDGQIFIVIGLILAIASSLALLINKRKSSNQY